MKFAQTDEEIRKEAKYFDTLYDFTGIITRLNEKACDGVSKDSLEKKICRLIPAFTLLCGIDEERNVIEPKKNSSKRGRPKKKVEPQSKQPEPEQLPDNFVKEKDGWGLCPVCSRKMIKLTSTTRLMDFPAYCKACKAEFIVSWWNVENKDMEYKRYVNKQYYIPKSNIRHEDMIGTGLKSFTNTRTSATERVAMHL